jgi:hypothetical protein
MTVHELGKQNKPEGTIPMPLVAGSISCGPNCARAANPTDQTPPRPSAELKTPAIDRLQPCCGKPTFRFNEMPVVPDINPIRAANTKSP